MMRFFRRTKQAVHARMATKQARKFIDVENSEAPDLHLVMLLSLWMSGGRYQRFLMAFSPRMRAEILRQERELLNHEPVLPDWKPNKVHLRLAAEFKKKKAPAEE